MRDILSIVYALIRQDELMQPSSLVRCVCLSTILWTMCGPLGLAQQAGPSEAPSAEPASAPFAQSRKLMQQGKLDEAIADLQTLEASSPGMKGLDLELGAAYYKKSDYAK